MADDRFRQDEGTVGGVDLADIEDYTFDPDTGVARYSANDGDATISYIPADGQYDKSAYDEWLAAKEGGGTTGGATVPPPVPPPTPQDTAMAKGNAGIDTADAAALAGIKGTEAPEVTYKGTDADKLKREAAIDSGESYVSPKSLVSGQMQELLDSDSDYMKLAERNAKERAADVGLLGSSMAVGAAQRAATEAALPIAQQDAQTYANAALEEQRTYNEISGKKAESDLSAVARSHIYDIDVGKTKLNASIKQIGDVFAAKGNLAMEGALKEMGAQWDLEIKTAIATLEADLQLKLDNNQISAREREWASAQATQIMAATYGTINDFMQNADFMAAFEDHPEDLPVFFNQWINMGKNHVEFTGATAGMREEYSATTGYGSLIGGWGMSMENYTPVGDEV